MRSDPQSKETGGEQPASPAGGVVYPEANPECGSSTELSATVVSGAITSAIPKPCTTIAGKNEVQ
jgi:hypothetical protein